MDKAGDHAAGPDAGVFTLLTNDPNGPVAQITKNAGASIFDTPVKQYSAYFQDDWSFSDHLTFNVGIRYDLNEGIGGLDKSGIAELTFKDRHG